MAPFRSSRCKGDKFVHPMTQQQEHKEKHKRSKAGCITCRLRGKRCDISQAQDGTPETCATCRRLRLPCLGFHDKRPEWLKDKDTLKDVKDRIKKFLFSQGLIKGQTGCGKSPEAHQYLTEDELKGITPAASPPPVVAAAHSPSASACSSSFSDEDEVNIKYSESLRHSAQQDRHEDSEATDSPQSVMTDAFPPYPQNPAISGPIITRHKPNGPYNPPQVSDYGADEWYDEPVMAPLYGDCQSLTMSPAYHPSIHQHPNLFPGEMLYDFGRIQYYNVDVLKVQYRLAHCNLLSFIPPLAISSEAAAYSMFLLSAIHQRSRRRTLDNTNPFNSPTHTHLFSEHHPSHLSHHLSRTGSISSTDYMSFDDFYRRADRALTQSQKSGILTEYDAQASLNLVSAWLFVGGHGRWDRFLGIAGDYVQQSIDLGVGKARGVETVADGAVVARTLVRSPPSARFIYRTTFWMDVLSSVTLCRRPRFLTTYRLLFDGPGCDGGRSGPRSLDADLAFDMSEVMGASNHTLLAIAEIAALAYWKDTRSKEDLDAVELVRRGMNIQKHYLQVQQSAARSVDGAVDRDREVVKEVFRHCAIAYLHSVMSGCHPRVPEIQTAVNATIANLQTLGPANAIDRSIVFCITICGVLTDNLQQKEFFVSRLSNVGNDADVFGNCAVARRLIERVWTKRRGGQSPCWRATMKELQLGALLLA